MNLPAPYSVKRHGVSITNCDAEPVQTPGCIQAHGVLLVLRVADLTIRQASENTELVLGCACGELLGRSLDSVFPRDFCSRLQQFIASEHTERNPLYLETLTGHGSVPALDAIVHTLEGSVLLELEPNSFLNANEPDYYVLVKRTLVALQGASTLLEFSQTVADDLRALTGHDRVMIYRFHEDGHGEVFAESKRADLAGWLGLHYPAEDIPKPAREIFQQIWMRPLPDVTTPLAEMVPLVDPDTAQPLVMTYCALRGPSVMYTEYLQNMGVRATLTLSLRRGDVLWGLIACHHYTGPRLVPYQVRAACELLAQIASLQLHEAESRELLLYRLRIEAVHSDLVAQAAQEGGLSAMTDRKPALLDGLATSGAALFHRDRWFTSGLTPTEPQLEALAAWLTARPEFDSVTRPIYATDALSKVYPAAAAFASVASGVLAFPLSRARKMLIMWFRPETLQTIRWAGDPDDKPTVIGPHGPRLTPRKSFELFVESVRQRSLPWREVELDAASRLRVLLMELVVGRSERMAELNADLTRINDELDSFAYVASHDLKEPLRGIHKYASQIQEDLTAQSEIQRRRLERLMGLTLRMDGLLDSLLHFSRVGRESLDFEANDMNEIVAEAIEMVSGRSNHVPTQFNVPRALPSTRCDRVRCREIFVNLLSNALKYNDKSQRNIEIGFIAPSEKVEAPNRPELASGHTVFYVRDNGIGIQPRHFSQVFKMFKRLHGRDEFGGGSGAGLAIVKKLVERHLGQVWLDSEPGTGTTFFFTLPCTQEVEHG